MNMKKIAHDSYGAVGLAVQFVRRAHNHRKRGTRTTQHNRSIDKRYVFNANEMNKKKAGTFLGKTSAAMKGASGWWCCSWDT